MEVILDLHIHSRYSRACSKNLVPEVLAATAVTRGIDLLATGDFTHPKWMDLLQTELTESAEGIFTHKNGQTPTRFLLGTEIASIKKHAGKTRRVHHLVFAPSFAAALKFNQKLVDRGCNVKADGRPIVGLTSKELLEIALESDPNMMLIPAHAWTPWFGIFGSKGGYNTLEEAFEELTPHIKAVETGLSSDPLMNWQVSQLDTIALISNSDAHSPQKLGREANVFSFANEAAITYSEIKNILETNDPKRFISTIEFYPEEGKYHYDGHAVCLFSCTPAETKKYGGNCPKCGKPLTIGVMNRIAELANRSEAEAKNLRRIPYQSLVPLPEIIGDTLGFGVASKKVVEMYDQLIRELGSEFYILRKADLKKVAAAASPEIADALERVRTGNIFIKPGYDGIFGVVKVFSNQVRPGKKQVSLEL